jgi:hypothetical protein
VTSIPPSIKKLDDFETVQNHHRSIILPCGFAIKIEDYHSATFSVYLDPRDDQKSGKCEDAPNSDSSNIVQLKYWLHSAAVLVSSV